MPLRVAAAKSYLASAAVAASTGLTSARDMARPSTFTHFGRTEEVDTRNDIAAREQTVIVTGAKRAGSGRRSPGLCPRGGEGGDQPSQQPGNRRGVAESLGERAHAFQADIRDGAAVSEMPG